MVLQLEIHWTEQCGSRVVKGVCYALLLFDSIVSVRGSYTTSHYDSMIRKPLNRLTRFRCLFEQIVLPQHCTVPQKNASWMHKASFQNKYELCATPRAHTVQFV